VQAFEASAATPEAACFCIGRFRLLRAAFAQAAACLRRSHAAGHPWIVIDEIGPLELRGEGFDGTLRGLLDQRPPEQRLLLVVRSEEVAAVVTHYGLEGCRVISCGELEEVDG
jgi:nucleoside-triphosphatase